MKLPKKTAARWTLLLFALLALAYCASPLVFGRVRARYDFTDSERRLTVIVREKPNEGWPIDGLAWLGFTPGKHTYWGELRSGHRRIAQSEREIGDTYHANRVIVRSADAAGATVFLGGQNGDVEWRWLYPP